MNCWRIFCRRILLFVSGLEVEAKLQEQEECIDQRPYVAPKAHDQPRPILQMMLGSGKKTKDHLKPLFFLGGNKLNLNKSMVMFEGFCQKNTCRKS